MTVPYTFASATGSLPLQQLDDNFSACLSNTVTIAQGGTGQTTQIDAFDALAPTTIKGDLIVNNGTDNIRLPVGSNTQILTADSTTASGLKWASSATSGTVTSVGLSAPAIFTVGGSPVTSSGTLALTYSGTALPIANGGTNATTSIAALTSLGAAARGSNTDITSIALTSGTIANAPIINTDIVNKLYADSIASGINFHAACQYGTTANLGTVTYNNGSSGVGATITNAGTQAALIIDGYTFTGTDVTNATRVLIKNQTTQSQNGIYTITNQGSGSTNWVLTRATDYDTSGSGTNEVDQGDFILVIGGTANQNTSWVQQTPLPITIGTTNIVFLQFAAPSGGVSSFNAGTTGFTPNTATSGAITLSGTLNVANGGTGVTSSTGTGSVVLSNSPTLVTPALGTPASGIASNMTVDGTDAVGYRNVPINSQSTAYTAVLTDSGKVIFHPSTDANARTFTIPANASVAYPLGTVLTFINMTTQVISIAITTDTMYLAGTGTTGTRSLAIYGMATAIKMTSTTWLISGSGLT